MKQTIPFYSNSPDDSHCFQAVIGMILKYYFPDKDYSWEELDKMTDKRKGLGTWPMRGFINLKKMGFEIINMEDFDYKKFSEKGNEYLIEKYGEEAGKIQIKYSDIPQERQTAKEFIKIFGNKFTTPNDSDIKKLLRKGYLVMCNVNSKALNNKKGYMGHFVLIYDFDKKYLYLHDPGLPASKERKVTYHQFNKAWAYPSTKEKNLTAFGLRK